MAGEDNRLIIALVIVLLLAGIYCLWMANSAASNTGEHAAPTSHASPSEPSSDNVELIESEHEDDNVELLEGGIYD